MPSALPHHILSVIAPMTQLNTPYPSTAYLTGFLRSRGVSAVQEDLALALALKLLSRDGLERLRAAIHAMPRAKRSELLQGFDEHFDLYAATITPTINFLQGRDSTLAHRIVSRSFLPEGPRFASLDAYEDPDDPDGGDPLAWAFGALGAQDRARHLATLYLNDLADVVRDAGDDRFAFVRYAESLALSQPTFDPLADALAAPHNLVDELLHGLTLAALERHTPTIVLVSVPFPGAVYAAFRIAQSIKAARPDIVTVLGGGYVNTELRDLSDPRLFDFYDYLTLDAGERPLLALLEHLEGKRSVSRLVRTFHRVAGGNAAHGDDSRVDLAEAIDGGAPVADAGGIVKYTNFVEPDVPFDEVGTPTWDGLPLDKYLSLLDMLNPTHRLWSDGRWTKLTVAPGR